MPQQLPKIPGVCRIPKSGRLHEEVVRALSEIAEVENKSFSYVVAEIIYEYFGLEVRDNVVEVRRPRRKKKTRQGDHGSGLRNVRRVASADVLRFEKRRNASRAS